MAASGAVWMTPAQTHDSRAAGSSSAPGKIYYDIAGHEARAAAEDVAVARLEQLYPFPVDRFSSPAGWSIRSLDQIVWAQEEPQNMGAWCITRHRLDDAAREHRACRRGRLRREAVAGQPERGLPHGTCPRAGPHRAGGARGGKGGGSRRARGAAAFLAPAGCRARRARAASCGPWTIAAASRRRRCAGGRRRQRR